MKGGCDLNKHALVRGTLLLTFILLFGLVVFEQNSQPVNAKDDISLAYDQFLPIVYTDTCVPRPLIPPNDPDKDLALESGINEVRVNHGSSALKHSDKISQAALRHSNDMAHNGFVDTIGSDGSDPGDRLNDACFHWRVFGEVVAGGYPSPSEAIAGWMEDYKDVILSNKYNEFGSAYAYNKNSEYKHYYTVDFGLRDLAANVVHKDYYTCSYTDYGETGVIHLNLYSIWPCDQLLESQNGVDSHR